MPDTPQLVKASFKIRGEWITRQINFIGIDSDQHGEVSDFAKYLQHPENRKQLSFALRDDGYDQVDPQGGPDARDRPQMEQAGWKKDSVPKEGEAVWLRTTGNLSTGGTAADVTDVVHPDNRQMAIRAADRQEQLPDDHTAHQREQRADQDDRRQTASGEA